VRTENQGGAGAGPLDLVRLAVASFERAFRAVGRLPFGAHVEQVGEEVVSQRPGPLGEDAVLGLKMADGSRRFTIATSLHRGIFTVSSLFS